VRQQPAAASAHTAAPEYADSSHPSLPRKGKEHGSRRNKCTSPACGRGCKWDPLLLSSSVPAEQCVPVPVPARQKKKTASYCTSSGEEMWARIHVTGDDPVPEQTRAFGACTRSPSSLCLLHGSIWPWMLLDGSWMDGWRR
jgi:hypothetical protein